MPQHRQTPLLNFFRNRPTPIRDFFAGGGFFRQPSGSGTPGQNPPGQNPPANTTRLALPAGSLPPGVGSATTLPFTGTSYLQAPSSVQPFHPEGTPAVSAPGATPRPTEEVDPFEAFLLDLESQGAFDYLDAPSPVPSITGAVGGFDQDFIDTLQGPLFDQIGTLTDQVSRLEEQLSTSQDSGISNQILLQLLGGFGQREEEERGPFSGGAFYPTGNPFLAT